MEEESDKKNKINPIRYDYPQVDAKSFPCALVDARYDVSDE